MTYAAMIKSLAWLLFNSSRAKTFKCVKAEAIMANMSRTSAFVIVMLPRRSGDKRHKDPNSIPISSKPVSWKNTAKPHERFVNYGPAFLSKIRAPPSQAPATEAHSILAPLPAQKPGCELANDCKTGLIPLPKELSAWSELFNLAKKIGCGTFY